MKTLILSCNTGQGHNSCAQAIKEYYDLQGDECVIEDALHFISTPFSDFLSWGHVTMYRHFPWLFRIGYRYSEKHPMPIATCLVVTDYTCSPSVKDSKLDLYFIPASSLSCEFECAAIKDEQIRSVGIPLRQFFYQSDSREKAKHTFGIPENHTHLLMMCGSMGCGPLKELAQRLSRKVSPDVDISIVCGTNRLLEKKLERKFSDDSNIHVLGYVQNMSLLMDSADLYLTKPGGISVTEASLKNLPMVLIDAVAGCEEFNRNYYVRHGGAKTGENNRELTKLTLELLTKQEQIDKMRNRLSELQKENASALIYYQMNELLEKKQNEHDLKEQQEA